VRSEGNDRCFLFAANLGECMRLLSECDLM
jgi:hypothetical protein